MKLCFESETTEVFLNPRIPFREQERYKKKLLLSSSLKGHIWVSTSGTSGRFKFAALSKQAILTSAEAVNQHLDSGEKDVWINVLPDFHVGGIGIWARAFLSNAKVIDYKERYKQWDPDHFHRLATESEATLVALVPTQIYDLVQKNLYSPIGLRAVVVGGGNLIRSLYDRALKLGWKLLPSYGLTECASQVATARHGEYGAGRVLSHILAKIDHKGRLAIKSPSLLTVYGIPEGDTMRIFDPKEEGWFKTEDRGDVQGGMLKVFGRDTDFVKIGGESVNMLYLRGIWEEVACNLKTDVEAVIAPVADNRLGHALHLFVESGDPKDVDRLVQAFQACVLPYERIREVRNVDKIPRNAMGKVENSFFAGTPADNATGFRVASFCRE